MVHVNVFLFVFVCLTPVRLTTGFLLWLKKRVHVLCKQSTCFLQGYNKICYQIALPCKSSQSCNLSVQLFFQLVCHQSPYESPFIVHVHALVLRVISRRCHTKIKQQLFRSFYMVRLSVKGPLVV